MTYEEIKRILSEVKEELSRKFGVRRIGVFGSYVRGDQTPRSDVDILVDIDKEKKIFDNYMDLKFYLENLFGMKVDLVLESTLRKNMKEYILKEVEYV